MSLKNPNKIQTFFFRTAFEYDSGMKQNHSIFRFSQDKQAQFRMEVLEFHKKWKLKATIDAYKISKPTIYRWKRLLITSSGRLESLIPKSRSPKTKRVMLINPKIVEFIKSLREEHHRLGKEKIKPILDDYCQKEGLNIISTSKIGRIIKKHHFFYQKRGRIYHKLDGKWAQKKLSYKARVKHSPKVESLGYLEMDTISRFTSGLKVYIYNAIDVKLKFQFSYAYTRLNSENTLDFFKKLEEVYPLKGAIKTVQTDNGLEFQGVFRQYLENINLKHLFIYPRCPKINAFIERANRTLQEEFIDMHLDTYLRSLQEFNLELMDYLIWYNTVRVHKSLGNVSPINYLLTISPKSQMDWTHTFN
jgi:transposase InsO family protein